MSDKLPTYGGQAVIEGVMMRGANAVAIAMRSPENEIVIHTEKLDGIYKSRLAKIPFVRGLVLLWDALGLGMRALMISANLQGEEDEQIEGSSLYLILGLSLTIVIGLFVIAPAAVGNFLENWLSISPWAGNLSEGIVRLLLLVGYIWVIGLSEDIQRVYMYHGAEHKTINAFEAGLELTPENVARQSLEHPRCGTAFLLTLALISVLVYALLGDQSLLWRVASRVLLIPVLAGLSYEYIRWTAKHMSSPLVRWLVKPNLALQRLTTREPSPEIIEVGIAAFEAMRTAEKELIT